MQWSLNTTRFSLSSLKLSVLGVSVFGVQANKLTEKLEGEMMFGNGPVGIGKVIGKLSSDIELGLIPEMVDTLKQTVGIGYAEIPWSFVASYYEPANPAGIYTVSNDSIWMTEDGLDAAREGAIQTLKFTGQSPMNWNGVTAIDMAARASDPGSIGAIFASFGLSL